MASNFKIIYKKNFTKLTLELCGDFDATSAYQVLNVIEKMSSKYSKVIINTGRLKSICEFGQQVFLENLNRFNKGQASIILSGGGRAALTPDA